MEREQDAPVIDPEESFTLDLCESCVDVLRSWKLTRANAGLIRTNIIPEEETPDPADLAEQIVDELFSGEPKLEEAEVESPPQKSQKNPT